jgi:hypothetical protein
MAMRSSRGGKAPPPVSVVDLGSALFYSRTQISILFRGEETKSELSSLVTGYAKKGFPLAKEESSYYGGKIGNGQLNIFDNMGTRYGGLSFGYFD